MPDKENAVLPDGRGPLRAVVLAILFLLLIGALVYVVRGIASRAPSQGHAAPTPAHETTPQDALQAEVDRRIAARRAEMAAQAPASPQAGDDSDVDDAPAQDSTREEKVTEAYCTAIAGDYFAAKSEVQLARSRALFEIANCDWDYVRREDMRARVDAGTLKEDDANLLLQQDAQKPE